MTLEARELVAGYGDHVVLQAVSLSLRAGQLVGLVGPNGSGKSTLLRVLSRTIRPRSGTVLLDGRPIADLPAREIARRLAFVPQAEPVLFDFTVREVVLMGRHPHVRGLAGESDEDFSAATRGMAATDTLHLADRSVTALSGGEHRRVLIARALAQNAPTILLDEPTAHLDITHQADLLQLLRRLADREGAALLAALHDVNLAAEFCDRIVLLRDGAVVAEGRPDQALTEETLERTYGAPLTLSRNPVSGRPVVHCGPAPADASEAPRGRVHVVCGGGTGLALLSDLCRRGYRASAGVLNRHDTDEAAAAALGVPTASEAPFSPIGPQAREACRSLMREADAIAVSDVPFGRGNLANLELALEARRDGKPVFLLASTPISARDFADGRAAELWRELVGAGAVELRDAHALDEALRACLK
jgi:iron complex transport system ATP-binding protein